MVNKYLTYGWRSLRNSPCLTVAAVITLGLAIGAGTAVFSVVKAVLLAPLTFNEASRLVQITSRSDNGHPSWIVYRDLGEISAAALIASAQPILRS